jgi:hypothetical protein
MFLKLLLSTLVLSCSLIATGSRAAETWHSGKIITVYPLANGSFVIAMDTDAAACTNTSKPKYHFVQVGQNSVTADGAKSILATALAAAAQGKTVTLNYDSDSASCYINRISVSFK